jgi:hypothetical protein
MPAGPRRELRDLLYDMYLQAGPPTLADIVRKIRDSDLPGSPNKDAVNGYIGGTGLPGKQAAVVAVAVVLAQDAVWDAAHAAAKVLDLWVAAMRASPPAHAGRPIRDWSPTRLEVRRAIDLPEHRDQALPELPVYVPRAHDTQLEKIVQAAADGTSQIAILVGGPSTGKTRACWEAIQALPPKWRLWHPIDPSHSAAAAAALGEVGPGTVIWLNEAQHYLLPPGKPELGEQAPRPYGPCSPTPTRPRSWFSARCDTSTGPP